jgi:hypothetical protein
MQPTSGRYVISWFGYDMRDFELFTESEFQVWSRYLREMTHSLGLRIERLGSPIDVIVGKEPESVSLKEFYAFQHKWDELNERFGFRLSGALWLMLSDGERGEFSTWECYQYGKRPLGDSIGRPQRHSMHATKKQAKEQ